MNQLKKFENKRLNVSESKHINGGGSGWTGGCLFPPGSTNCAVYNRQRNRVDCDLCPSNWNGRILIGVSFVGCGWGSQCILCKYVNSTCPDLPSPDRDPWP